MCGGGGELGADQAVCVGGGGAELGADQAVCGGGGVGGLNTNTSVGRGPTAQLLIPILR